MIPNRDGQRRKAEDELRNLAISDHLLPSGSNAEAAEEVVGVHKNVDGGIGDEGEGEEGLGGVEPEVGHDDNEGVVVHMEEGEALPAGVYDNEESV